MKFLGYSSDPERRRAQRLAMIKAQHRAQPRRRRKMTTQGAANIAAAAQRRRARELEARGLDPRDTSVEYGGSPDFELDLLPDRLTGER